MFQFINKRGWMLDFFAIFIKKILTKVKKSRRLLGALLLTIGKNCYIKFLKKGLI